MRLEILLILSNILFKVLSLLLREFSKEKSKLILGRKSDCDIFVNESGFSRIQTTVFFKEGRWYIKDGSDEKASGSGTWYVNINVF